LIDAYQRMLRNSVSALGPDHLSVVSGLNNLAIVYMELGRYAEAELVHVRALAIWAPIIH